MNPQPEEGKASVKNIKDYLHLYLGCEIYAEGFQIRKLTPLVLMEWDDHYYPFKPILRSLSDMTEEEAIELQCITTPYRCIDWDKDPSKYDVTFHTDHKLGKDHPNYKQVFSITVVDLRRDFDYMNINLNGDIIRYNHEADKDPVINERVHNHHETTRYLLSKHFDLFGLIESGLAIDKTKLNSHV